MAASAAMQTIPASLVARATHRNRVNHVLPATFAPLMRRNANMQVRCMAEDQQDQQEEKSTGQPLTTPVPKSSPTLLTTPLKASPKFTDLFAFSGPAPERINGRLAMIGFVAAMTVELSRGQDVFTQISNGGIPWFLGTSVVLTVASLIPLFNGVSVESKSEGVMTSDAEMWNGRIAMLGLVALAFTEYVKGGTLV